MQAFMTCHDDLHFYTLVLSKFKSYFVNQILAQKVLYFYKITKIPFFYLHFKFSKSFT
jgi:hypothetical protein